MEKGTKIVLLFLIIALIIIGVMSYKNDSDDVNANIQKNTVQNNIKNNISNNIKNENTEKVNNTIENKIENKEEETDQNQTEPEKQEEAKNDEQQKEQPEENKETVEPVNNDEKALNMVKNDWGEDSSVRFKIDEKKENGIYTISVVDKKTTAVIIWYEVDINKNTIKEK